MITELPLSLLMNLLERLIEIYLTLLFVLHRVFQQVAPASGISDYSKCFDTADAAGAGAGGAGVTAARAA